MQTSACTFSFTKFRLKSRWSKRVSSWLSVSSRNASAGFCHDTWCAAFSRPNAYLHATSNLHFIRLGQCCFLRGILASPPLKSGILQSFSLVHNTENSQTTEHPRKFGTFTFTKSLAAHLHIPRKVKSRKPTALATVKPRWQRFWRASTRTARPPLTDWLTGRHGICPHHRPVTSDNRRNAFVRSCSGAGVCTRRSRSLVVLVFGMSSRVTDAGARLSAFQRCVDLLHAVRNVSGPVWQVGRPSTEHAYFMRVNRASLVYGCWAGETLVSFVMGTN